MSSFAVGQVVVATVVAVARGSARGSVVHRLVAVRLQQGRTLRAVHVSLAEHRAQYRRVVVHQQTRRLYQLLALERRVDRPVVVGHAAAAEDGG